MIGGCTYDYNTRSDDEQRPTHNHLAVVDTALFIQQSRVIVSRAQCVQLFLQLIEGTCMYKWFVFRYLPLSTDSIHHRKADRIIMILVEPKLLCWFTNIYTSFSWIYRPSQASNNC